MTELGAVSLKFYNGHVDKSWRCDDEKLAYPLYERARELGIKVLQFHKGNPFGTENIEQLRPNDLQCAARDFPDLTFVIHHLAMPYFDECVNIAARFPNIYLALSATVQPRTGQAAADPASAWRTARERGGGPAAMGL